MNTLKDLKQSAHKYEWTLIHNSWFADIPSSQATARRVSRVLSTKLAFKTIKDGVESESWLDFPKSSELSIKQFGLSVYEITIERKHGDKSHVMKYRLSPIYELFQQAA